MVGWYKKDKELFGCDSQAKNKAISCYKKRIDKKRKKKITIANGTRGWVGMVCNKKRIRKNKRVLSTKKEEKNIDKKTTNIWVYT